MTIPVVFQAKATTIKLVISTAIILLFITILSASLYGITCEASNIQEFKNKASLWPQKIRDSVVIPMPGGGGRPFNGVFDGRIIRRRANESRWVDVAVPSPKRSAGI